MDQGSREPVILETVRRGDAGRWRELVHQVREMRQHQRDYFTVREVDTLHKAKAAERAVDKLLEDFDGDGNPRPIQAKLFEME